MTYSNYYLGGTAWDPDEARRIDEALWAAVADPGLNAVVRQYFGNTQITAKFAPSQVLPTQPGSRYGQPEVEEQVRKLYRDGQLKRFSCLFGSTLINLVLPRGAVLEMSEQAGDLRGVLPGATAEDQESSLQGLGGYHGSVHVGGGIVVYYAVSVYSEGNNGIVAFDAPWKNVVATLYHEVCEARTDPDVQDAIRKGSDPSAEKLLGWVSDQGEEIGDYPVFEAGADLSGVMREVKLASGAVVPVQLMYSNLVSGPEEPRPTPKATALRVTPRPPVPATSQAWTSTAEQPYQKPGETQEAATARWAEEWKAALGEVSLPVPVEEVLPPKDGEVLRVEVAAVDGGPHGLERVPVAPDDDVAPAGGVGEPAQERGEPVASGGAAVALALDGVVDDKDAGVVAVHQVGGEESKLAEEPVGVGGVD